MRVFYSLLIIVASVILFMLPVTEAVYDFRTDLRTDSFSTTTGGVGSANVMLFDDLYDCDGVGVGDVEVDSDNATDTPVATSVNCTTRILLIGGLSVNTTRVLDVTYPVDALWDSAALNILMDRVPWIWMLVIISFGPVALVAIFMGRT